MHILVQVHTILLNTFLQAAGRDSFLLPTMDSSDSPLVRHLLTVDSSDSPLVRHLLTYALLFLGCWTWFISTAYYGFLRFTSGASPANVCTFIFRLLDVIPGRRNQTEMKLMLVFEHIDQDLARYLEKVPSPGMGPDRIRVGTTTSSPGMGPERIRVGTTTSYPGIRPDRIRVGTTTCSPGMGPDRIRVGTTTSVEASSCHDLINMHEHP